MNFRNLSSFISYVLENIYANLSTKDEEKHTAIYREGIDDGF